MIKPGNEFRVGMMRYSDACWYLGIRRSVVYVLIGEGEIKFIKLGISALLLTENLRSVIERRRKPYTDDGTDVRPY
jgi:excisionase family DNA binding protein